MTRNLMLPLVPEALDPPPPKKVEALDPPPQKKAARSAPKAPAPAPDPPPPKKATTPAAPPKPDTPCIHRGPRVGWVDCACAGKPILYGCSCPAAPVAVCVTHALGKPARRLHMDNGEDVALSSLRALPVCALCKLREPTRPPPPDPTPNLIVPPVLPAGDDKTRPVVHCLTTARNAHRFARFEAAWNSGGFQVRKHVNQDYRNAPATGQDHLLALALCGIGHVNIWRELADQPGWHLIAEDDALPLAGIEAAIELAKQSRFQVVKLFHQTPAIVQERQVIAASNWISATCYLVHNTAHLAAHAFCGSPDRLIHALARGVGIVVPIAAIPQGAPTIPYPANKP
jgi:hypothetical protein